MSGASDEFHVGDIRVRRVEEWAGSFLTPQLLFAGFDGDVYAATREAIAPDYLDHATDAIQARIQSWVVDTGDIVVLFDTGCGNHKTRPGIPVFDNLNTDFLARLGRAGYAPDDIDFVVCSHLHVDHVGWNTMLVDGKWVPTFANARYLMGRIEYEHWMSVDRPDMQVIMDDSVRPVMEAGLVDLIETEHRICPEITLMPSFGHTPGHVSVKISSRGEEGLITGDFLHHPCQIGHPEWSSTADHDPDMAHATRIEMFGALAGKPTLVLGTHFATPTAGRIVADGNAWRLVV